jgi:hypothetical protein
MVHAFLYESKNPCFDQGVIEFDSRTHPPMTDPVEEITKMARMAVQDAYARGWQDCADAIAKAARGIRSPDSEIADAVAVTKPGLEITIVPRTNGRPASKAIQVVEDCIAQAPGKKGVEVIKAAQLIDAKINERTARTCLRRLKISKKIWQRNGLWYPKPRQRPEHENEEASSSPPQ